MLNVLKTSWLAKPSRSSAWGRSSLMNEPSGGPVLAGQQVGLVVGPPLGILPPRPGSADELLFTRANVGDENLFHSSPQVRVGIGDEEVGCFDDVRVGVVDDPAFGVRHVLPPGVFFR